MERILQWRVVVQELLRMGFNVQLLLDHLHEIAYAYFKRKA